MAKHSPDVVVVGGSAAGLATAWAAARAGADVLLLESKAEVGVPAAPASLAFDFLWEAPFHPSAQAIRRRHRGLLLRSPAGHSIEVEAPLSLLDRSRFDTELAAEARARGAVIATGVKGLRALGGGHFEAEELEVRARVTVFADGARTMATPFVRSMRNPHQLAWGAILAFERRGAASEERVTLTLGAHAAGGRSQLNPLEGDRWTHWTFFRGAPEQAEARARKALALDARLNGWPASVAQEARFEGVAPDPVYTLPGRIGAPGILVTGGAAGQGGLEAGLGAGVLAGTVAAASAQGTGKPRDYERIWKRRHLAGYLALRAATDRLSRLSDAEVDRLLAAFGARPVDIKNPLRAVSGRGALAMVRATLRSF